MIVGFFLDVGFNCMDGLFDASFVEVECENRKQLRMIKRSNKNILLHKKLFIS